MDRHYLDTRLSPVFCYVLKDRIIKFWKMFSHFPLQLHLYFQIRQKQNPWQGLDIKSSLLSIIEMPIDNLKFAFSVLFAVTSKELEIPLLFLALYSQNINIIERLWKFTKKTTLYAKYYETPDKFHRAITDFFQTINHKNKDDLKNY